MDGWMDGRPEQLDGEAAVVDLGLSAGESGPEVRYRWC